MCACVCWREGGGHHISTLRHCALGRACVLISRTIFLILVCNDKHIGMHVPVPFAGTVRLAHMPEVYNGSQGVEYSKVYIHQHMLSSSKPCTDLSWCFWDFQKSLTLALKRCDFSRNPVASCTASLAPWRRVRTCNTLVTLPCELLVITVSEVAQYLSLQLLPVERRGGLRVRIRLCE